MRESLLFGPEFQPEELERALIRYDRKTELLQEEKERPNKHKQERGSPRRSALKRKPYNRHEMRTKAKPNPEHRASRAEEAATEDEGPRDYNHRQKYNRQSQRHGQIMTNREGIY